MLNFEPGVLSGVLAISVLALPFFWKLRGRAPSIGFAGQRVALWITRSIASTMFVIAMVMAANGDVRTQLYAAPLLVAGAAALTLAVPLAQMLSGPSAMTLDAKRLRVYWITSTQIGILLIIVTGILFYAWRHVNH
jgi:hypothetical protein